MKTTLTVLAICMAACCVVGCSEAPTPPQASQKANTKAETASSPPDFAALKEGMTLDAARKILGSHGRPRENSSLEEAIHDFDFDNVSVELGVRPVGEPLIVNRVTVRRHSMTAAEVGAARGKKWAEWVEAHSPKNQNKENSEPTDALDKQ